MKATTPPSAPESKPLRLAAVDIGTNSIRCIIVEVDRQGGFVLLDDEKAAVRLGEGLGATGAITAGAWLRAEESLLRMHKIVAGYGVGEVAAVATSAVRRASNGQAFVKSMQTATGFPIAVISGETEAELAALSARHHFALDSERHALIDVGGGSTEIVIAAGPLLERVHSFELGAVLLAEEHPVAGNDKLEPRTVDRMHRRVRELLATTDLPSGQQLPCMIGSGGTVTTLGKMVMAARREDYESLHGYEILRSEIVHLAAMLARLDLPARRAVPGLNPDRADIIVAGLIIIDEVMRALGSNVLRINEKGLREGLILRMLQQRGLLADVPAQGGWRYSVAEFARACRYDADHAQQVGQLALQLFDALAEPCRLAVEHRRLLETAALLHDIGYFIHYDQHHKHSYHLIRHADLIGFTPREREIIANLARYHRKSLPKKKHDNFQRLAAADQQLVRQLGGILRLADGLDRRRNRQVRGLRCEVSAESIVLSIVGDGDLSVELFGGEKKKDLLEQAVAREVLIRADG